MTSQATSTPADDQRWDARLWAALVLLCGVLFLDGLDVSMVGVALPSIREDLGLTTSELQWIVSGYVLGYGGLLLLGGRFADLLGRRRVLLWALGVFAVASLLGALTDDGTLLVVTRFLKGAAAAFTAPASFSIITTTFAEGPARNKALSIYTACGATGFSLGLVLGGLLTEAGWRWTFLLPVPVAIAILLVAPRVLARDEPVARSERGKFDFAGAVTITAGMLLLVRSVVEAPEAGWGSLSTVAGLSLAVAILAAFVAIELRAEQPLIRLGILRSGPLVRANLTAAAVFGGYVSFQFIGTLYLQGLQGWTALETALAFLPGGLLVAFGAPRIGPLADRYGTGRIIAIGSAAFLTGYALFLRIGEDFSYFGLFFPTMLLIGVGFALCFPAFNIQGTAGVPDHEQGLASGLVNTSFQVGGAVVLAITSAVVTANTGTAADAASVLDGFRPALAVVTGVAALGLIVALAGTGLARVLTGRSPAVAVAVEGAGEAEVEIEQREAA